MSEKNTRKPLAIALGAAFVTSLATAPIANAAENPFAMSELAGGYMVADSHMEGADKSKAEGKCGEAKCGAAMTEAAAEGDEEGAAEGAAEGADKAKAEGKCGEGKCGGDKSKAEGKCGEAKCGANKTEGTAEGSE